MFASLALYTSPTYSYPTFQARPDAASGRCALRHCAEQFGSSPGYRLDNGVSGNIIAVGNNGTCTAVAQAARRSGVAVVRGSELPGGLPGAKGLGGPWRREGRGRGAREGRSTPYRPYPWTSAWRMAPQVLIIYLYLCAGKPCSVTRVCDNFGHCHTQAVCEVLNAKPCGTNMTL